MQGNAGSRTHRWRRSFVRRHEISYPLGHAKDQLAGGFQVVGSTADRERREGTRLRRDWSYALAGTHRAEPRSLGRVRVSG